jgi:membrane protein YdbS with pleckstrin-like domain
MTDAEIPAPTPVGAPAPAGEAPAAPDPPPADPPAATEPALLSTGVQHLDPRVITLNRITGSIVGAIFCGMYVVAAGILTLTRAWPWWALTIGWLGFVPFTGLMTWLALKWPEIDYRHWRYRVDVEGIEIWSGVVWRQAVVVPRSRVQHIDLSQGPIERSYRLATLSIHTAGTEYSKVDLPGLDHGVALRVRDALLPKGVEPAV